MKAIDHIRHKLADGNIVEAIDLLLELGSKIENQAIKNDIIATSARFNINYRRKNLGLTNDSLEENRVIVSILNFLDKIELGINDNKLSKIRDYDFYSTFFQLKSNIDEFGNLPEREQVDLYEKSILLKEILYRDIDLKMKSQYPSIIFNKIYYEKTLSIIEYKELNDVVSNNSFEWIEKSIIISSLTLSLLREFDSLKIELLINFIVEFENQVWQRAAVGLVLALYNRDKIILLYPDLVNKLSVLKQNPVFQEAILQIAKDVKAKYYINHFSELSEFYSGFDFKFFSTPEHWFVPYYRNNPILQSEIKNFPNVDYIDKLPSLIENDRHLSNSEKYAITLTIKEWSIEKVENFIYQLKVMSRCTRVHTYDVYLTDIYAFVNNFEDYNIKLDINSELSVTDKIISTLLLDEVERLFILAEYHRDNNEDELAITFLEEYVESTESNAIAYCRLGMLYEKKEDYQKSIAFHQKAYIVDNNHTHSYFSISRCYFKLDDKEKCAAELTKLLPYVDYDEDVFYLFCGNYYYLEDYEEAYKFAKRIYLDFPDSQYLEKIIDSTLLLTLRFKEYEVFLSIINSFDKDLPKYMFMHMLYEYVSGSVSSKDELYTNLRTVLDEEDIERLTKYYIPIIE